MQSRYGAQRSKRSIESKENKTKTIATKSQLILEQTVNRSTYWEIKALKSVNWNAISAKPKHFACKPTAKAIADEMQYLHTYRQINIHTYEYV